MLRPSWKQRGKVIFRVLRFQNMLYNEFAKMSQWHQKKRKITYLLNSIVLVFEWCTGRTSFSFILSITGNVHWEFHVFSWFSAFDKSYMSNCPSIDHSLIDIWNNVLFNYISSISIFYLYSPRYNQTFFYTIGLFDQCYSILRYENCQNDEMK